MISSREPGQTGCGAIGIRGAAHRARTLWRWNREGPDNPHFYVGIEGGVVRRLGHCFALGVVCVIDRQGREGWATSPWFELPQVICCRLSAGEELGSVIDELAGERGLKYRGERWKWAVKRQRTSSHS